MDWQTAISTSIVFLTVMIFLIRMIRSKKKSGCGHGCGCDKTKR
ncbi:MAG: FeoB-associated Cys-rich membrane protein [Akkermansiaceae bacterium]|nr:FeoB-associated Cys-rich membrane protein [Akkermansiaceae bacterium]MBJ7395430.1 FeoB-associated Cys-rich membrane protein [Akkermansiaceae bacterium]MBJ7424816.1 FeoB-associated Cys-rich membrane protein [Akkermansiaceae bacterium]